MSFGVFLCSSGIGVISLFLFLFIREKTIKKEVRLFSSIMVALSVFFVFGCAISAMIYNSTVSQKRLDAIMKELHVDKEDIEIVQIKDGSYAIFLKQKISEITFDEKTNKITNVTYPNENK